MIDAGVLAALALSAATLLPARPAAVAVADVDRDGTPELAVLLVWDDWGTLARDVETAPGQSEIDVVPAIRQRRELRVYEVREGMPAAAPPLVVGREVLALDAGRPGGDAFVLTDDGPARLGIAQDGAERRLSLAPVADVPTALRGAERVYAFLRFVHDPGLSGGAEVFVPVDDGIAVVRQDGSVVRLAAPVQQSRSGVHGIRRLTFPAPDRLEPGGAGLLDVSRQSAAWHEPRAAWRPVDADGIAGTATVWRLGGLLELRPEERAAGKSRELADVADLDADGTFEAAVAVIDAGAASSLGGALAAIRGLPGRIDLHPLRHDGSLDEAAESSLAIEGHLFPLPRENGVRTPFRDLDGDGRPELVTFTVSIGVFGAGRAVVTGNAKARLNPVISRRTEDGRWVVVEDAVPSLVYRQNLRSLDLSRFFDWPGDLNRDGRVDLVEVDGREIKIRHADENLIYPDEPTDTIRLLDPIAGWGGVRFRDLDGDGDLDLLAFTPIETSRRDASEALSRATRVELRIRDERAP